MKLSNTTCIITYLWVILTCACLYIMAVNNSEGCNSTLEYSAKEIKLPFNWFTKDNTEEISNILDDESEIVKTDDIANIADDVKKLSEDTLSNNTETNYEVPINEAVHVKSGEILEGEYITIDLDKVMMYVDAEYDKYDWDTKNRIRDIYILKEILVNQLDVAPMKASAIIGNICCEDSFAGLTKSAANLDNIGQAKSVLGNGGRGYGCVQWTAAYRQKGLQDYYEVVNKDLDWELTSIVAETAYLYNELTVSGLLGDLSVDDEDLMHVTGIVGCEYEAYARSTSEWYKSNGHYKTGGCERYRYAKNIYDLMCKEVK